MKLFKANFWEQVIIKVTSGIIVTIIISLASIFIVVIVSIYDPFKKIVENNIPVSTLIILIVILFIALMIISLYTLSLKRKSKLEMKRAMGVYWDIDLNPHCPSCKTMLTNYGVYQTLGKYEMGMQCISCDKIVFIGDENGQCYKLDEAKKVVRERFNSKK